MKTPVESYVVRIYRRRSGKERQLVGVLEGPRLVGSRAFSSVEELWEILEGRGQPTYLLPFLGSNSSILNSASAASGAGVYPLLLLHLAFLAALVVLAWARGKYIGKVWLIGLPIAAGFFDIIPGLSLIPLAPTVLHLAAIIVGVKDDRKTAGP